MNKKIYTSIILFTGFVLLGIIVLQVLWLNNIAEIRKKELYMETRQALSYTAEKLEKKENREAVMNYMTITMPSVEPDAPDSPGVATAPEPPRNVTFSFNGNMFYTNPLIGKLDELQNLSVLNDLSALENLDLDTLTENIHKEEYRLKREIKLGGTTMFTTDKLEHRVDELDSIMQHIAFEIDLQSYSDRINPDTLREVLTLALKEKGIDVPFEYAVMSGDSILSRSPGYVVSSAAMNFETKLFPNDIFEKDLKLVMYYPVPSSTGYIFSRMKTMLMLTGIFTLGILVAFYLTLRSIRRQKKISEMKNDFINNITHEFKTPIATSNIAIAALENEQVKNDPGKFMYYTGILKEENTKMNMHVEKVLQMAMMDRGKIKMHPERTDVNDLLEESVKTFELILEENHADIFLSLQASPAIVMADPFHLANVLNNVIDNAVKYSGEYAKIEVGTRTAGRLLYISIKDNGPGMSSQVQKNAFEQFYRGQGGDLHDVKGFGLGLNYVKKIITLLHGEVKIKSRVGEGTEMIIELPLA